MKLKWIRYQAAGKQPKYLLVVALGQYKNKLCCIGVDGLSDETKQAIRQRAGFLDRLPLPEKLATIKKICPEALTCYKTLSIDRLVVDREYEIQPPKPR